MPDSEHEQLIPNLRALIAEDWRGLEIDSPTQWVVSEVKTPEPFFRSLISILPPGAILYMEGCNMRPWAVDLYERHAAPEIVPVARDTIAPMPRMFHIVYSATLIDELCEMVKGRDPWELFDHIKAYHSGRLLFTFHDAFAGELRLSGDIPAPVVEAFCRELDATWVEEPTKKRDLASLKRILQAFENGGRLPVKKTPFWKRVWNRMFGSR
ncbi:MAG TPA: hypothetical protein VG733_06775 [Chthoniobacteraceae bacterium]|nr:hypothetical protein [Chthoniobacteraceae bacterium]